MSHTALINIHHPQPHDLVDDPVAISGIATGFEAVITARVRGSNGAVLVETPLHVGANGLLANFHAEIALDAEPVDAHATLEVFEESARGDGSELNKVVVPIVIGRMLLPDFLGYTLYTVERGDTLSMIAHREYGVGSLWPRIFEANRQQISNPDRIFVGQVLRIPH